MDDGDDTLAPLAAGGFSTWLRAMRGSLQGDQAADVPCDGCTACCRSSQFIHIAPDETETLAHIPSALLFPAPRLPAGHVLLGYDEDGCCPMLIGGRCSIYHHRPRTCRTYDCRIFAASGVAIEGDEKGPVAEQAQRWRFDYPDEEDHRMHRAVEAAAQFLGRHGDLLPGPTLTEPTQRAVAAVEIADLFLGTDRRSGPGPGPDADAVRVALDARTTGEQGAPDR